MTDIIVVRQLADDSWQWRYADSRTGWREEQLHTGDIEALTASLPRAGMAAYLLIPGERVVSQRVTAEAREYRHLQKLVPFQLEDQAIEPVDELHFSLGPVRDGRLPVAYASLDYLQDLVTELESAGCDVQHCVADFLALRRQPDSWTLCIDGERLLVHSGEGLGLAVELDLATVVLPALVQQQKAPQRLDICAPDAEAAERLREQLPESLQPGAELEVSLLAETQIWQLLDINADPELEFRNGALGRRLPLLRWWQEWRIPVIATAAAFVLAIGVTLGQYWQAQGEQERIMAAMHEVFRQAVPDAGDNVRDPERRLSALVSGLGGSQTSTNITYLLSEVAPEIGSREGLSISSFRYSQDNRELQLNIEANDFALLEQLRNAISEKGLTAELLRVSAQGDVHQARMRVLEGGL